MKVGDQVSVIQETISGKIIEIDADLCKIEDQDGFERLYKISELALVAKSTDYKIDDYALSKDIQEKIKAQHTEKPLRSFEIDLHIEELLDSHSNMTNHEILTKQMTACRGFVQNAIAKGTKKIVLIHGKGEGVLKSEIHLFLNKLHSLNGVGLEYHDASYSEYGMGGATEVIFY